jgi:cytoskeleton protein RodZ
MARPRQKRSKAATPIEPMSDGGDGSGMSRIGSVGATLRDERLRRGWELADVASHLKIRRVHLDAIEEDRFDDIPSGTYAVNFVRSYSEALGLDSVEMVRRFREELAGGANRRLELHFPQPLAESRLPGGIIILVSVAIAALGYVAWTSFNQDGRETLARVDPVPQQMQPLAPAPAAAPSVTIDPANSAPAPAPASPASSSSPSSAEAPAAAPAQQVAPTVPPPAPPPPAPSPAPATQGALAALQPPLPAVIPPPEAPAQSAATPVTENPNGTRIFGEPGTATRVVITAQADSWVQVRDAGGGIVFMRILKAGDAYHVPNRAGLLLTTGSAGSIDIKVDGKPVPSLGRTGFVRRDVPLEPERLLSGAASEPPRPAGNGRGNGG